MSVHFIPFRKDKIRTVQIRSGWLVIILKIPGAFAPHFLRIYGEKFVIVGIFCAFYDKGNS
jgi:hypothetical protein